MPPRLGLITCVVLALSSVARAGEPRAAIAPVPIGPGGTVALQRAFQDELPRALQSVGFQLAPQGEIDIHVGERPAVLRCRAGRCLAEEAALFQVGWLILPRLEVVEHGYTVGLSLYDAGLHATVAAAATPCADCTPELLRQSVRTACASLRQSTPRPTVPVVATTSAPPKPRFRVVKWVVLAAGLAAAGAGAGVWAIDGQPTCSLMGSARECPRLYDTAPIGAALVGVGGALLVTSVVMIALDRKGR